MTKLAVALASAILTLAPLAPPPAQKPVLVVFETERGAITMEIDVVRAPITGGNFLKYVDGTFYDGGMINRAVGCLHQLKTQDSELRTTRMLA